MILELRYFGDPILRQQASPVGEITPEIQQFCKDLIETMLHHKGIGLAAPQVGRLLRIFVSTVDYEDENGEIHEGEPRVYINPQLKSPSPTLVERSEGCLSIPKLYMGVLRPLTIQVEALDINGEPFTRDCYGYLARNMMHEMDHLNGVLFIDRIKGKLRKEIEPDLRLIRQKYYRGK